MKKTIVAICYDFDQTLAQEDMQTYGFFPKLNVTAKEFWGMANDATAKENIDGVLSYLKLMIDECKKRNFPLTRKFLNDCGKNICFFNGVNSWFERLNNYADKRGIKLEHYILSSGNREIIEGCQIYKYLNGVYACEFYYDQNGIACWPKNIVNYTLKTQYLFRINKGLTNEIDGKNINKRIENKRVEFRNMIYIGDGYTDIPSMTLVKEKGGTAISVYSPEQKEISLALINDERVNFMCKSDYAVGSELDKTVKLLLDSISVREKLINKENNQTKRRNV